MLTSALIDTVLNQFLDTPDNPQIYSDAYLVQCATEAEKEACRRAKLIKDKSTQTADNTGSGTATSTSTGKLVDSNATFTAVAVGKTVYNTTDNTFAVVTAVDTPTQLSLSSDVMVSGEAYVMGDASKAIAAVCVESGKSNYSMSGKIIKVIDCYLNSTGVQLQQVTSTWLDKHYYQWRIEKGTPLFYMEEKGSIILVPQPDSTLNNSTGKDMLFLSVYRLPLNDLTLDVGNAPEISEEYHYDLVYWIAYLVFTNPNNAANLNRAEWHERQFELKFGTRLPAQAETIMRELPKNFRISSPSFGIYGSNNS